MPSQAALDGIQQYGLKWKYTVRIGELPNIPEVTENMSDRQQIIFADKLIRRINQPLKRFVEKLGPNDPEDLTCRLNEWIQDADETFVWDNIPTYGQCQDCPEYADGLIDELLYRLNEMYDLFDYYRVLVK